MAYCCTVDVVNRKLLVTKNIKYPKIRQRLLIIMAEDQKDRYSADFFSFNRQAINKIKLRDTNRIKEVLKILNIIKTPNAKHIGLDGSRVIWLIALHNYDYKDAGKIILKK